MRTKILIRVAVVLAISVSMTLPCHAIEVTITNPISTQSYAVGATITYNGQAKWASGEGTLASIQVELRYDDPNTGMIIDSESAVFDAYDLTNKKTGFKNPTPATLNAAQDPGNHSTPYYFVATPYTASFPYFKSGVIYRSSNLLGAIQ